MRSENRLLRHIVFKDRLDKDRLDSLGIGDCATA